MEEAPGLSLTFRSISEALVLDGPCFASVLLEEAKEHGVLSTPLPTSVLTWGPRKEHLGMDTSVVSSAFASLPSAPGAASSSYTGIPPG